MTGLFRTRDDHGRSDPPKRQSLAFVKSLNSAVDPRTNEPEGLGVSPTPDERGRGREEDVLRFLRGGSHG